MTDKAAAKLQHLPIIFCYYHFYEKKNGPKTIPSIVPLVIESNIGKRMKRYKDNIVFMRTQTPAESRKTTGV